MHATASTLVFLISPLVLGTFSARGENSGGPAANSAPEFGAERPVARIAPHVRRTVVWTMPSPPEKIFPLLCPVREYDWIPTWRARLVHSASGVAEKGCIFETLSPREGRCTWICTRYDPPARIEYTVFQENGVLARLEIGLAATADGTEMTWTRTWHALNAEGESGLRQWDEAALDQLNNRLQQLLRRYLESGSNLPQPPAN